MKTLILNILAVIVGLVVGSVVNMSLITVSPHVIPPPEGADVKDAESLRKSMHLAEPKHFVFPFLAHALGTLVGALAAYLIAVSYRAVFAYVIGGFFLLGGIGAAFMIQPPMWYNVLDLVAAYIPMAWLATLIGPRFARGEDGAKT